MPEVAVDCVAQTGKGDFLDFDRHRARLNLGEVKNIADQIQKVGTGAVNRTRELHLLRGKIAVSILTKLLAKKESIAADVYDKLRFRMITHTEDQLVFAMRELTQRLIPFNYVIPGQSVNDIIRIRETLDRSAALRRFLPEITDLAAVAADKKPSPMNEFSGPGYRVINFVADLPVRMDRFLCRTPDDPLFSENGTIVFVLTEFQIIDARTAENNESGENSHDKYKERQAARVRARLMHGMKDDGLGD